MTGDNLPWPEKHRPQNRESLVGNSDAIDSLRRWIQSWEERAPKRRAALLVGPPGTGKTASVGALASDLDLELVEFNSSDKRNKATIETLVGRAASQQTLDGRGRIILLDEVDGLSGTSDRGGVSAILRIIKESVHPIVMTANDPDSPRLKNLYKVCRVFSYSPILHDDILLVLGRIAKENDTQLSADVLYQIAEGSKGDLRAAISDLESHIKRGSLDEVVRSFRNQRFDAQTTLRRLFISVDPAMARSALSDSDLDYESLLLWAEENIHLHLVGEDELADGFDGLSLADMTLGRIRKSQNWKLLSYMFDFLADNMAMSRSETPFRKVKYSRPSWPLLVWQGNRRRDKEREVLTTLGSYGLVSRSRARRTHLDAVHSLIRVKPRLFKEFVDWLGVDKKALKQRRG
ncbi:replication factor C large subunit [Candidatus Thorarchaeota archaeon]|jgi:replication factor C large subunit|nr:MAG: replication factor C large subunit [Candidatus Thorarchaeota archaeon]